MLNLKSSPAMPLTCLMLSDMRPGQRLVYYRGNLGGDEETPVYTEVLSRIERYAKSLEVAGKIKIVRQKTSRTLSIMRSGKRVFVPVTYYEHVAEAL